MLKKCLKLIIVFLCGYFIIEWVSINQSFILSEFLGWQVMHPLEFFAVAIAFFVGIVVNGEIIRESIHKTGNAMKKRIPWRAEIFWELFGIIAVFYLLFQIGSDHTLVLFSLSILYGMISSRTLRKKKGR